MKYFVFMASLLTSLSAFAAEGVTPNLYRCTGNANTNVTYTSTSFGGFPTMSVTLKGQQVKTETKINQETTRIGNLLSVSDMHMVPVDGPEVRYSVVIPEITLTSETESLNFTSVLVKTSMINPFFHAHGTNLATENNEFINVNCTAQHVVF